MKNVILALVFVLLMVGAAMAVTKTRGASVGVLGGAPAAAGAVDQKDCASKCSMKKEQAATQGHCTKGQTAGAKKTCPITGKPI